MFRGALLWWTLTLVSAIAYFVGRAVPRPTAAPVYDVAVATLMWLGILPAVITMIKVTQFINTVLFLDEAAANEERRKS